MPTLDEHHAAYRAARAAGDEEAAQVIRKEYLAEQKRAQGERTTGEMSIGQKLLAGAGQGLMSVGLNAGDLVGRIPGLSGLRPKPETMREFKEDSAPLLDTGAGQVGAFIGETVGTLPLGGLAGAGTKALAAKAGGRAARLLAKPIAQATVEGGAAGSLLASPDDRAAGGMVGAMIPAALGTAGKAGRALYRGVIQPSKAARILQNKGVDLTIGQLAPGSLVGQMEELASDLPGARQIIQGARDRGRRQWQGLVLDEARAPGMPKLNPAAAIDDRLDAAYAGFRPAYGAVSQAAPDVFPAVVQGGKGTPLLNIGRKPGGHHRAAVPGQPGAIAQAVDDPRIYAEAPLREQVIEQAHRLGTALPAAPGATRQWMTSAVPTDDFLRYRSDIRKLEREARKAGDFKAANLFGAAEEQITAALDSQMPADAQKALRAADAAYRKHKVVSDAVARSGDQVQGFTPAQLSAAVKGAEERGVYARGAGGPLRLLARAGRETFESPIQKTGIRALPLMASLPVTATVGTIAATQGGRKFLTGATGGQRKAQTLELALRRKLGRKGTADAVEKGGLAAAVLGTTARDREE